MRKKYEFTGETKNHFGQTLHQIRALVAISARGVAAGDVGGWVKSEKNLAQKGNAWVYGDAQVHGDARVSGDAQVYGNAECLWLSKVGSESGTLTACRSKDGIWVSRGCFSGSLEEFERAVKETHGDDQVAQEYALLIEFIKLRVKGWADA